MIAKRSADFDRLVALYEQGLDLRDRATSEGLVGDSAFHEGRELEAAQHYRYADDYRDRARHAEASAEHLAREMTPGVWRLWRGRLREKARAAARTRRYGSDHLDAPAYID